MRERYDSSGRMRSSFREYTLGDYASHFQWDFQPLDSHTYYDETLWQGNVISALVIRKLPGQVYEHYIVLVAYRDGKGHFYIFDSDEDKDYCGRIESLETAFNVANTKMRAWMQAARWG